VKNARLILILSVGIVAVALALLPLDRPAVAVRESSDFDQPLPGRAAFVAASDLVAAPAKYSRKRVVLEGIWHRGFEQSSLEVIDAQGFFIWVELWDSKEFAAEAESFFERISAEGEDWAAPAPVRMRAEGSFYYRSNAGGGGFGHLGFAHALFLVDRILLLERVTPREPSNALEPTPTSVTSPAAQEPRQP
jgi:hypothetical protein